MAETITTTLNSRSFLRGLICAILIVASSPSSSSTARDGMKLESENFTPLKPKPVKNPKQNLHKADDTHPSIALNQNVIKENNAPATLLPNTTEQLSNSTPPIPMVSNSSNHTLQNAQLQENITPLKAEYRNENTTEDGAKPNNSDSDIIPLFPTITTKTWRKTSPDKPQHIDQENNIYFRHPHTASRIENIYSKTTTTRTPTENTNISQWLNNHNAISKSPNAIKPNRKNRDFPENYSESPSKNRRQQHSKTYTTQQSISHSMFEQTKPLTNIANKYILSKTKSNTESSSSSNNGNMSSISLLSMSLTNEGHSVRVTWNISAKDIHQVQGFVVSYRMEGRENYDSSRLGSRVRTFILHSLHEDKQYSICVQAVSPQDQPMGNICQGWSKSSMKIVMGIIAGSIFLLPCLLVVIWVIHTDARMRKKGQVVDKAIDRKCQSLKGPSPTNKMKEIKCKEPGPDLVVYVSSTNNTDNQEECCQHLFKLKPCINELDGKVSETKSQALQNPSSTKNSQFNGLINPLFDPSESMIYDDPSRKESRGSLKSSKNGLTGKENWTEPKSPHSENDQEPPADCKDGIVDEILYPMEFRSGFKNNPKLKSDSKEGIANEGFQMDFPVGVTAGSSGPS